MCGKKGISGAVLNSTESHWMWIEEEDVEESCNNRRSKSRGHKSYDSKWAFSPASCWRANVSSLININHEHYLMKEHW